MTSHNDSHVNEMDMNKSDEERIGRLLVHRLLGLRAHYPHATGLSNYDARSSDVVITTFAKAGTTLLQQMAYQLVVLSGGGGDDDKTGEDYTNISAVSPWIDYRPEFGMPFYETRPRVLKTHSRPHKFSDAGLTAQKHVVVIRDPEDYPASWLNFLYDSGITNGSLEFAPYVHFRSRRGVQEAAFHEFVRLEMLREDMNDEAVSARHRLDWFDFADEWLTAYSEDRRDHGGRRILVLFYEDIVADLRNTVRLLAEFMNVRLTSQHMIETVLSRCERSYMGGNEKFKCEVEASVFNLGTLALRARRQDAEGFKEFKFHECEIQGMQKRFRKVFGVGSYDELKEKVKRGVDF